MTCVANLKFQSLMIDRDENNNYFLNSAKMTKMLPDCIKKKGNVFRLDTTNNYENETRGYLSVFETNTL